MQWLLHHFSSENALGTVADVLSVASFWISLWVAFNVKAIRKQYLARVRLPDLLDSMRSQIKELGELLRDYDSNKTAIDAIFARTQSTVKSICNKVKADARIDGKSLLKKLQGRPRPPGKDFAWQVHTLLSGLLESVDQYQKDSHWR